jgi:hypothetical protein
MSTEKTTIPNITHFNKRAFDSYEFALTSLSIDKRTEKPQVTKSIDLFSYCELGCKIDSVIDAIQIISYPDTPLEDNKKLEIVYNLAEILKALIPQNELEFLDELLISQSSTKSDMIDIKKI